jgi:hypothetical protein
MTSFVLKLISLFVNSTPRPTLLLLLLLLQLLLLAVSFPFQLMNVLKWGIYYLVNNLTPIRYYYGNYEYAYTFVLILLSCNDFKQQVCVLAKCVWTPPILPYYVHRLIHTHTSVIVHFSHCLLMVVRKFDWLLPVYFPGWVGRDSKRQKQSIESFSEVVSQPTSELLYLMMCSDQNRDHLLTTSQSECSALVSSRNSPERRPSLYIRSPLFVN